MMRGCREGQASAEACGPPAEKNAGGRYHRFSRNDPALPAQRLYGLYAVSPATGLVCHRSDNAFHALRRPQRREARTLRLHRPQYGVRRHALSTLRHIAAIAPRTQRVVTFAQRPSSMRRDGTKVIENFGKSKRKIFTSDLDGQISLTTFDNFGFPHRPAFTAPCFANRTLLSKPCLSGKSLPRLQDERLSIRAGHLQSPTSGQ